MNRSVLGFARMLGCSLVLIVTANEAHANKFNVVHSFPGFPDGKQPKSGLFIDSAGNVFGTTSDGGAAGDGTVFQVAPDGTESILYSFAGGNDGFLPWCTLISDGVGNLYGTTQFGGASNNGTVFKITPGGVKTTLYSFAGGNDGAAPTGTLAIDRKGNLYGTTENGGTNGFGTAFEVRPNGKETVLYSFSGAADGSRPASGLIRDRAGVLYGTTQSGGDVTNSGAVFKLAQTPDKQWHQSVLYTFTGGSDGAQPSYNLAMDRAGNIYGTTLGSDCFGGTGCGTVFKVAPDGTETVLHHFANLSGSDGAMPTGLTVDQRGDVSGVTALGAGTGCGGNGCGTLFTIPANGVLRVLHSFKAADGSWAVGLSRDGVGNLFGVTFQGGASNFGTVFEYQKAH